MRALAILASYNEARFVAGCLQHLREQGVDAYLVDNESRDGTVDIARQYLGSGLLGIEVVPRDGTYRWRGLLARKEELASILEADWYLHLDLDEIPLPPSSGETLAQALAAADAAGYNAAEFAEFTFVPTREDPDHDHADFRRTMRWYYPFAPRPLHLVRAWKRQPSRVDLVSSAGHRVSFPGRAIAPQRFSLCHYLFLSREHLARKYGDRRFDAEELRAGWHGWRATVRPDEVRLPWRRELRELAGDGLDPSAPSTVHCLVWPEP